MTPESNVGSGSAGAPKSFIALRHPAARMYLIGAALAMMADSVEHVISYWMIYEKFQSPALAGFAVISHWLPFLLFSFWSGSLADRYDPRRIIQLGMVLFMLVSAGWGILFWLDTLEVWHAAVLLVIHGFAGVLWAPAAQLFIHAIVGEGQLQSAIRTMASSRTLGLLFGPAVGGGLLLTFGPTTAIFLNILIYLPLTFWLFRAPEQPREETVQKRAMSGFSDVIDTLRDLATNRLVISMTILAGATSLIVGNAHQAQMPEFAHDLGEGDAGFRYSILLTANAAGALFAGIVLESRGLLPANPRTAFILALMWCCAIGGFAVSSNYYLSISLLLCAGFLDLSFNSMARTIAQLNAPASMRGRAIGLFNVSSQGLRTFSGVTVGLGGSVIGIHYSLAISAALLMVVILSVFSYFRMARLRNE